MSESPSVVVIGGPNGAGKTTISREVIAEILKIGEFVNADVIAQGLSGFEPEKAAMQAGRIMLSRLRELAAERREFAFETTMASRTFAPWLSSLISGGYEFHLVYVWLRSPELAIRRVRTRVRRGGHFVPDEIVTRRYARGIHNFVHLCLPLATRWRVYDNSSASGPDRVASGGIGERPTIMNARVWQRILEIADDQTHPDNP